MNAIHSPAPRSEIRAAHANDVAEWDQSTKRDGAPYRLISLFAPAPQMNIELFLRGSFGQERFY